MARPSDISPGGQVYDRTTGTWAGENTGNVGDDRSSPGRGTFVIHDANGPVGVHLAPARQVAAGQVQTGPGGGGSGPGAASVATANGGGGSGPGAAAVVLGPLKPKMQKTATQIMVGVPVTPNPWFSNADQWEERYGEPGDWLGGVVVMGADAVQNVWNFGIGYLGPKLGTAAYNSEMAAAGWWGDAMARRSGPLPPQEPVDWGR